MRAPKFVLMMLATMLSVSCAADKLQYVSRQLERVIKDPNDHVALAAIKAEMTSSNPANRTNAAGALALAGEIHKQLGPEMLDALIAGLSDREQSMRRECAAALKNVAQPATIRAIPNLASCLEEGDNDVAWYSAEALGNYGPLAKEAVPALILTLEKFCGKPEFNLISETSAEALGKIGDATAKPVLTRATHSTNERTRAAAENALIKLAETRT